MWYGVVARSYLAAVLVAAEDQQRRHILQLQNLCLERLPVVLRGDVLEAGLVVGSQQLSRVLD